MCKNKAFCSPGTQNGRRVMKVYSENGEPQANHNSRSKCSCKCNNPYDLICGLLGGCSNLLLFIYYIQNQNSCYKVYGDACSCSVTQDSGGFPFFSD